MMKKKLCPQCGGPLKGKQKYCCYLCSIPAMLEAAKQIKSKEGPIYEKWKKGLKASLRRI